MGKLYVDATMILRLLYNSTKKIIRKHFYCENINCLFNFHLLIFSLCLFFFAMFLLVISCVK